MIMVFKIAGMNVWGFCLYGSELWKWARVMFTKFLSCLYGSERVFQHACWKTSVSKLPVRQ